MRGLSESPAITLQEVHYLVSESAVSLNRLVHSAASSTPPPWYLIPHVTPSSREPYLIITRQEYGPQGRGGCGRQMDSTIPISDEAPLNHRICAKGVPILNAKPRGSPTLREPSPRYNPSERDDVV